ncbi:hypothetical protein, partial [Caulobacter sp.]|uniref:hypothetical protein n=1 Tax=Caulobacter sp. TaxID=78 RepID=UPI002B49197E
MLLRFFIALIFSACVGLSTAAVERDHSGFYTDLKYIAEADDYLGFRIDVHQGPKSTVEFELCEGSCYGGETLPATIEGDQISFVHEVSWTDSVGNAGITRTPVTGRFVKGGLMLR